MIEYDDYGTATWRYWQKIRNDVGARGSYRDRPPVAVRARVGLVQREVTIGVSRCDCR
ncbi:hypothetical protein [Brevibacterium permense]|uniref:Uncharacterized protein n=1 Tax=Brevibacterium permense TaxID=234834 RepID=A0ABN2AK58_9MICO|nr:hypothetical protein [Brevibacterium permense]